MWKTGLPSSTFVSILSGKQHSHGIKKHAISLIRRGGFLQVGGGGENGCKICEYLSGSIILFLLCIYRGKKKNVKIQTIFCSLSLSLTPLCKKVSQSGMQLQSEACCATQQHQAIQMKTVRDVSCTPQSAITVHIILIPRSLLLSLLF